MEEDINDIFGTRSSKNKLENKLEITNYRYPALRTIAGFYMLLAYLVGIFTVGLIAFSQGETYSIFSGFFASSILFLVGAIVALGLAAASESIKVFLDIEYNTRKKADN
jgi:hypothetical protein